MSTPVTYGVDGMTCEHCVRAVTDELTALPGVRDVGVDLVVGGTSTVRVVSDAPLAESAVRDAVDEAGYTLVVRREAGHAATEDAHSPAASTPAGLAISDSGWTLRPADTSLPAGRDVPYRFTIEGPDGATETSYVQTHTRDLHLVVVRRDLSTFQHVHPTRTAEGTWSAPLDLDAGVYRVLADFRPTDADHPLVLGADLLVPGEREPVDLPAPRPTAVTTDGYTVTLHGTPVAGREGDLVLSVSKGGTPVTTLQPYLGAYGHLVALRAGDLAYLHTHVEGAVGGSPGAGPDIAFATTFPTAGTYRLFLDFRAGGVVRTAAFTVEVRDG